MCHGRQIVVRRQPFFGAAMASLAANAVGDLEFLATFVNRHVVGVAIEADVGLPRTSQAQARCNQSRLFIAKNFVGARVRVGLCPRDVFVLQHAGALARDRGTVALR